MKRVIFPVVLFFQAFILQAQEHHPAPPPLPQNYISISTDLLQYILYQPNIGVEYRKNDRIAFGLNVGLVIPDPMFFVNTLADGQYKMPGTVYHGVALRLYYKYYRIKKPNSYWSAQLVGKYEWYNNVNFLDQIPGTDDSYYYKMDEKCTVLGLEFLHGHEWGQQARVYCDFFYGFGFHVRIRNFKVFDADSGPDAVYLPEGTYSGYIWYPTPVVGLRLGVKFPRKPAPTN